MTKKKKRSPIAQNAMPQTSTSIAPRVEAPQYLEGQVRQRAYEIYETRGREDGHDTDDWLQAEAEITGKKASHM